MPKSSPRFNARENSTLLPVVITFSGVFVVIKYLEKVAAIVWH